MGAQSGRRRRESTPVIGCEIAIDDAFDPPRDGAAVTPAGHEAPIRGHMMQKLPFKSMIGVAAHDRRSLHAAGGVDFKVETDLDDQRPGACGTAEPGSGAQHGRPSRDGDFEFRHL